MQYTNKCRLVQYNLPHIINYLHVGYLQKNTDKIPLNVIMNASSSPCGHKSILLYTDKKTGKIWAVKNN